MPRSGADARRRLREAALELYRERGYDTTTTAQIAARAGVTERTYFRHFADKREVLFDGQDELAAALADGAASAPSGSATLDVLLHALRASVPLFVEGRPIAVRRAEILAVTPALRERADAKTAALTAALAAALIGRGLPAPHARLAASVGLAMLTEATALWSGRTAADLERRIDEAAGEVRGLS